MHAFVAIKRKPGRGSIFAYLPSSNIALPAGWEWAMVDGKINTMDVSKIAPERSLEDVCRLMNVDTDLRF